MLDLDVAEGGENLATSLLVFKPNGERVKLDTELAELIRSKKNKDIVNVLRRNTEDGMEIFRSQSISTQT